MRITMNLARAIEGGLTLSEIVRHQHRYHEWRRWSVFEVLQKYPDRALYELSASDKAALWHVSRGELTTVPGGLGVSRGMIERAKDVAGDNRAGAVVLHAGATWISRYWLEEEAHHEVAYGTLLAELCKDFVPDDELMRFRALYPADNLVRSLMLLACVEVEVSVSYAHAAKTSTTPLLREIFTRIMRDEIQHRQYFLSFVQGLIDTGVYPAKDALAMALHWVRPNGELFGTTRDQAPRGDGDFVNWWETIRSDGESANTVTSEQHYAPELFAAKTKSILKAIEQATGQRYATVRELQRGYVKSLAHVAA